MAGNEPKPGIGDIDALIGSRIRVRRLALGIDQQTLGHFLGLTAQQIQDYESGADRIGPIELSAMAEALSVPILFFFDDLPPNVTQATPEDERQHGP
jgi:transcriptional regulator with XRE-family HTH domain